MAEKRHQYHVELEWVGNTGAGTESYRSYERAHEIRAPGKPVILGSADPTFRGDAARWNPEELLVASLSACHQLWFLALCAQAGIVVTAYQDDVQGEMVEDLDGAGQFAWVVLRPSVTVSGHVDETKIDQLHHQAHAMCFIARSVNFPVSVHPSRASALGLKD